MSHLHITDGVLHWSFLVMGFVLTFLMIGYILFTTKKEELFNNIAKMGIISALMLIVMSIPLGPLPFHINLSILTALILGPKLGFISVFLVNIILGTFGHGGITVIGLNTVLMGVEVVLGYYVFSYLLDKKVSVNKSLVATIIIAITVSTALMIGVVTLGNIPPEIAIHTHDVEAIAFYEKLSYGMFSLIVFGIVAVGIVIESLVITIIVNYFRKIRPDYLLKGGN